MLADPFQVRMTRRREDPSVCGDEILRPRGLRRFCRRLCQLLQEGLLAGFRTEGRVRALVLPVPGHHLRLEQGAELFNRSQLADTHRWSVTAAATGETAGM